MEKRKRVATGHVHKKKNCTCGRPTVMTPETIAKLEQAFSIDATVEEACSYADISRDSFYDFLKINPKFSDRMADLRNKPILKARQTIFKSLDAAPSAQWFLERKRKHEFSTRSETEVNLKVEKMEEIQEALKKVLNG